MKPISIFRPLGLGSRLMLVGVLAAGAYSFASRQDQASSTVRFDETGARMPASTPGQTLPTARRPLEHKPEPSTILESATVALTRSQRAALDEIDRRWKSDRADLELKMKAAVAGVQGGGRVSLGDLQAAGEHVGELSRLFELRRAQAWAEARATLTSDQIKQLEETR